MDMIDSPSDSKEEFTVGQQQPLLNGGLKDSFSSDSAVQLPGGSSAESFAQLHLSTYFSMQFRWVVLIAISSFAVGSASCIAFAYQMWAKATAAYRASLILGFFPLTSLVIMLGFPVLRGHFSVWLNHYPLQRWRFGVVPFILSLSYFLGGALQQTFSFSLCGIVFSACFLVTVALQEKQLERELNFVDGMVFLVFVMCINFRLYLWPSFGILDYQWWNLVVSIMALLCWACVRPAFDMGYTFLPGLKDIISFVVMAVVISITVLPINYFTSIHVILPTHSVGIVITTWIRELLSTTLCQEILFRSVLLNFLFRVFRRQEIAVFIGALLYGIAYWQLSFSKFLFQFYYFLFTFITGLMYGISFWKSGKILSGVLVHSLLNTFLEYFLLMPLEPPNVIL